MVSKKILVVVIICLAILLGAVGAYAYIQISTANQSPTYGKITYSFYWQGDYVTPELTKHVTIKEMLGVDILYVNITFERNDTHLIITVKTNSPVFRGGDYVGIVFDPEYFKAGGRYTASNISHIDYLGEYENGHRFLTIMASDIGKKGRHQCYFVPEEGYTYVIPIDLSLEKLTNDRIHVEYDWSVAVEFCFGKELIV
jgi:hypothetical protein